MSSLSSVNIQEEIINQFDFENEFTELAQLFSRFDIHVKPFGEHSIARYRSMPSNLRNQSIRNFKTYKTICESVVKDGHSLNNNLQFVWYALKELKLKPSSEFFDKILDTDVIEIYNAEGVQIFRNFRFFEFCGYTLADIFLNPWFDLYYRNEDLTKRIFEQVAQCLTRKEGGLYYPSIEKHEIFEIFSGAPHTVSYSIKHFCAFYGQQGVSPAFAVTTDCHFTVPTSLYDN